MTESPALPTTVSLKDSLSGSALGRLFRPGLEAFYRWQLQRAFRQSKHVIYTGLWVGIGDEFMCSSVVEELQKRDPGQVGIITSFPELFENNPNINRIFRFNMRYVRCLGKYPGLLQPNQWLRHFPHDPDAQVPPRQHIFSEINRGVGIQGEIRVRPVIYLTPAEIEAARFSEGHVIIQSTGSNAKNALGNKAWYPERFQAVVNELAGKYLFIQLGNKADPPLQGATDLRGKTTLRQAAAILAHSRFYIGQSGFLMHLARSVERRSVIVFGGREIPELSGYEGNENLFTHLSCSPCYHDHNCDFHHECMQRITAQDVLLAVSRLEKKLPEPFADQLMTLESLSPVQP